MEVQLFGFLGNDAEVKQMKDGREQVSFSVAETTKRGGQEVTNWVSCWYGNKNVAPYLKKGTRVYVRGELSANIYQSKEGDSRVGYSVFVNKLELLGGQNAAESKAKQEPQPSGNKAYVTTQTHAPYIGLPPQEDDMPF